MTTEDRVRELAACGMTASQIARELGVSRQRISQITRLRGIKTQRGFHSAPPLPKIKTGGVNIEINRTAAGSICELLVAADLTARGFLVYMPIKWSRGFDLIAMRDGKPTTVEVKSGNRRGKSICYSRSTGHNPDVFAIVITGEPVVYEPPIDDPFRFDKK